MINMTNSNYNGWFFKKINNGQGEGECKECGKKVKCESFSDLNSLKPCKCKDKSK